MFTTESEYKGFTFTARCVVSISGDDTEKDKGLATVTFFHDPHGAIMSKRYSCDLSGNQGVGDIEDFILSMDEYSDAIKI